MKTLVFLFILVALLASVSVVARDTELQGAAGSAYKYGTDNSQAGVRSAADIQRYQAPVVQPVFTRLKKEEVAFVIFDAESSDFNGWQNLGVDRKVFSRWIAERYQSRLKACGPVNLRVMKSGKPQNSDVMIDLRIASVTGESRTFDDSKFSYSEGYSNPKRKGYSRRSSEKSASSTDTISQGAYVHLSSVVSRITSRGEEELFSAGPVTASDEVLTGVRESDSERRSGSYTYKGRRSSSSHSSSQTSGMSRDKDFEAFQLLDRLFGAQIEQLVTRTLFAWQEYEQKERLKGIYEREENNRSAGEFNSPSEKTGKNGVVIYLPKKK